VSVGGQPLLEELVTEGRIFRGIPPQTHTTSSWRPDPRQLYLFHDEHLRFGFLLKNHGQIPATLIGWSAVVVVGRRIIDQREPAPGDEAICVLPQRETSLEFHRGGGPEQPSAETQVQVNVRYSGYAESQYRTFVIFKGRREPWRITTEHVQ
jgi:hypothetical protein